MLVLFVCTGNTCRSPLAEAVARDLLRHAGAEIRLLSAGIAASPGAPASELAIQVAREAGLDLTAHRAQPLTRVMLQRATLVLVMGEAHRRQVRQWEPAATVYLLAEYAEGVAQEVPDPMGRDLQTYRRSLEQIRRLVEGGFRRFQRGCRSERI